MILTLVHFSTKAMKHIEKLHGAQFARPELAFHGTSEESASKILKVGFLIPGVHTGVRRANGSVYGRGVYVR